jgi:glutamate/aspartate transport system substrate-binding protein
MARITRSLAALALVWVALAPGQALAQTEPPATALTGVLKSARDSGFVTIGYRESSIPFSYLSAAGEPVGYSIEICRTLVEAIGREVDRDLGLKFVPVTSETRIEAVVAGKIDLECGSTTSNIERQKVVSFSPTMFVSGTKLMVKVNSPVRSYRDLKDKTVVVTAGTTNEKAMRDLSEKFKLDLKLLVAPDHGQSFAEIVSGKAEAFALDDVLLYGLIAQNKAKNAFTVLGDFLSYDPYGIMFRKGDAPLAKVVAEAFHQLAEDGDLDRLYKRWFLQRLPGGDSIDLPMSPQLNTIFRSLALKPE